MKSVSQWMLYVVMLLGGGLRAEAEPTALVFPPMTGSVVDAAQMLDSQTTVRLARLLRAHEQATGERVVVVTLADLQGTSIEEFGPDSVTPGALGRTAKTTAFCWWFTVTSARYSWKSVLP